MIQEKDLKKIREGDRLIIAGNGLSLSPKNGYHHNGKRVKKVTDCEIIVEGGWVFSRTLGDSLTPPYSCMIHHVEPGIMKPVALKSTA